MPVEARAAPWPAADAVHAFEPTNDLLVTPDTAAQAVILGVVLNGAPVRGGETFIEGRDAHLLASAAFLQR